MDLTIKLSLVTVAVLTLGFASAQTPNRPPAPAGGTYADLPGVRIWFRDTGGSGIPVVFMHAATGSSRNWTTRFLCSPLPVTDSLRMTGEAGAAL